MSRGLDYLREINEFSEEWSADIFAGMDNYERAVVCAYALGRVGVDADIIEGTILRKVDPGVRITGLALPSDGIEFVSTTGVVGPLEAARSMFRLAISADDIMEISLPFGSVAIEEFMNQPGPSQVKQAAMMVASFLERRVMDGSTPRVTPSNAKMRL